jgi:LruC domain-containing protein
MKNFIRYILLSVLVIVSSCEPNEFDSQVPEAVNEGLQNLVIPDDFNFESERDVTLNINDETPFVKYEFFAYSSRYGSEAENILEAKSKKIYSGRPYNGTINQVFSLATSYDKVYISRKDGLEYTYEIIDISNNIIDYTSPFETRSANRSTCPNESSVSACPGCDYIFENGDFDCGPATPNGNNVDILVSENAVDGWSSTTNKIRICTSTYEGVDAQSGGWFSELNSANAQGTGTHLGKDMYQRVCTTPGSLITWSVWHRGRDGVDEAVVKFGSELGSMTVEGTMITDNTAWVNYTGTYTVPVGQYDTYFMLEAVSTSSAYEGKGNFIDHVVLTETPGSGSCDPPPPIVCYPNCDEFATIAFEDKWPMEGDYDFNDVTIGYRIVMTLNSQGDVVGLDYIYTVKHAIAATTNGYGIELEGILPEAILSVAGPQLTEGFINTNANGTEFGQRNAVIVFFDNAQLHEFTTNTISVVFTSPIATADLVAPFNPFLIINKRRVKEVHLPTKAVTSLGGYVGVGSDDPDGDFLGTNGLPWGINVPGEFRPTMEGVHLTLGYDNFAAWASSGGTTHTDWWFDSDNMHNEMLLN